MAVALPAEVKKDLPKFLTCAKAMWKTPPLSIQSVESLKAHEMSGFKVPLAAPAGIWDPEQAEQALASTGLYEAAGLALWLRTNSTSTVGPSKTDINWQSLQSFKEAWFSRKSLFKASVQRGAKKARVQASRLLWPCEMVCGVVCAATGRKDNFYSALPLLASGLFVLWAWYDKELAEMLWECGLSVTIQLRVCATDKDLALAHNLQSESVHALKHSAMSDSFLDFVLVTRSLTIPAWKDGENYGLKFHGATYNPAIHKAASALIPLLAPQGNNNGNAAINGPVESAVAMLDLEFGREALSNHYTKLSKLASYAKSAATATIGAEKVFAWMTNMLRLAFRLKISNPQKVTDQWLDKDRKTGASGFWPAVLIVLQAGCSCCLVSEKIFSMTNFKDVETFSMIFLFCREVFDYARKLAAKLPQADANKLNPVLETMVDPDKCWNQFLKPEEKDKVALVNEDDNGEDSDIEVPMGKIGELKEQFNKATGMLLDFLARVMSFKFLSDCKDLAGASGGLTKALQVAEDMAVEGTSDVVVTALVKEIRVITQMFDGHAKTISAIPGCAAPAPALLVQLTGDAETAEDEGERQRQWKGVQSERKRFVTLSVPKSWDQNGLQTAFRAATKVFSFNGNLNASHRMIIASADLFDQEVEQPWQGPAKPNVAEWSEVLAFASSMSGPCDFVFVFDGRSRDIRRLSVSGQH
eukprot:s259_g31.t1